MDSLNNSLHDLENLPIEYAPKIKTLDSIKHSLFQHLSNPESAHEEELDFQLEKDILIEKEEDCISKESTTHSEISVSEANSADNVQKETGDTYHGLKELANFCILNFLKKKSN